MFRGFYNFLEKNRVIFSYILNLDTITRIYLIKKIRNHLDDNYFCGILVDSGKASDMVDHKIQI